MATRIRLQRHGRKKRPFFRIVVAEKLSKRDGKVLDVLGYYNPQIDPPNIKIDQKKFNYWKSVGAKPTETVRKLL